MSNYETPAGTGGGVFLAFFLGALAGAAAALLYAPASGEETREKLSSRIREGRDKASELAKQGQQFVRSKKESVKSAIETGRDAYDDALENAR